MSAGADFLTCFAQAFASTGLCDDETLYSFAARIHRLAGPNQARTTAETLFGHPRFAGNPDLVLGLSHLDAVTGGVIPATIETLRLRTVLGPYLVLMDAARKSDVLSASKGYSGSLFKSKAGFGWNAVSTRHQLRFCAQCRLEQAASGKLPYWRTCHQWPGVEVCLNHCSPLLSAPQQSAKGGAWLLPDMCGNPSAPADATPYLIGVAHAICWLASHRTLSADVLTVMIRTRLNQLGVTSGDIRITSAELSCVAALLLRSLAAARGVPSFRNLTDPSWIQAALRDRRTTHPLRFAVLLALGSSCEHIVLDRDYLCALERMPELPLFPVPRHLRLRAPREIYEALDGDVRLAEAVLKSGIPFCAFQLWLKKDYALQLHWRNAATRERSIAAAARITAYLKSHPSARRSEVLRQCGGAARYLQGHDPLMATSLIPAANAKFSRQESLF